MDTESLNSELDKFVLVYFYFHFIFFLFQKKKGRCYDNCIFYLIASEFCISALFTYLVVKFSFSSNIRPDET